jgi:hypothetical protein
MIMKAAPPIEAMEVVDSNTLKVWFEGMAPRYINLAEFPLLGIAKKLLGDEKYLKSFRIVDGIPEWNGRCLLGPEDLLAYSKEESGRSGKTASHLIKALKTILLNK